MSEDRAATAGIKAGDRTAARVRRGGLVGVAIGVLTTGVMFVLSSGRVRPPLVPVWFLFMAATGFTSVILSLSWVMSRLVAPKPVWKDLEMPLAVSVGILVGAAVTLGAGVAVVRMISPL